MFSSDGIIQAQQMFKLFNVHASAIYVSVESAIARVTRHPNLLKDPT